MDGLEQYRAAQHAEAQAREVAKEELQRMRELSVQRVTGFIDLMEQEGIPKAPIFTRRVELIGRFRVRVGSITGKRKITPISDDEYYRYSSMSSEWFRNNIINAHRTTYKHVGAGWRVVAPYYDDDPRDARHRTGILIMDNSDVVFLKPTGRLPEETELDEQNLTLPKDAWCIERDYRPGDSSPAKSDNPPFILDGDGGRGVAVPTGYNILLSYAANAIDEKHRQTQ